MIIKLGISPKGKLLVMIKGYHGWVLSLRSKAVCYPSSLRRRLEL